MPGIHQFTGRPQGMTRHSSDGSLAGACILDLNGINS